MENIQVSRELIENTQKYFREAAKTIYTNKLRFSTWKGFYNVSSKYDERSYSRCIKFC